MVIPNSENILRAGLLGAYPTCLEDARLSLRDLTGYRYLTHVEGVDHGAELVEGGPGVVVALVEPLLRLLHRKTLTDSDLTLLNKPT